MVVANAVNLTPCLNFMDYCKSLQIFQSLAALKFVFLNTA